MTLDSKLVNRKASLILNDLKILNSYKNLSLKQYLADYLLQLQVERLLERIIGRLIDINYHILKEKYQTIPTDYTDSFAQLFKHKAISKKLLDTVKPAVGLRNILAHEYDTIDPKKVYAGINLALKHLPAYLRQIIN